MADRSVRVDDTGDGTLRIALRGDIDFTNCEEVREEIRTAIQRAQPGAVHVDLADVPFLDSSGVAVLVSAHRVASALGARYTVGRPTPAVHEHLRLTGVAELFGLAEPTGPDQVA